MDILNVKNICKNYPKFSLKNVSFKLEPGRIMGFVGRNGAGKTTTIKGILNIIHLDSGSVEILGKDMLSDVFVKEEIGSVLNGIDYYPTKSIKDISSVYSKFYKNWNQERFYKYLEHFELDENKKYQELSQGMKIKFYLSLALSHDAKLLILDEPTSGLDPISREEILDIFLEIIKKEDRAILFSTHITSDLDKVANDITYIKNGEIIASETKNKLINKFKVIEGNVNDFDEKYNDLFIAHKNYVDKFKGLILSTNVDKIVDSRYSINDPTIDDIIVFLEMEGDKNEEFTL